MTRIRSRARTRSRAVLAVLCLMVLTVVEAPLSFAAPVLTVSATTGLKTGQSIVVEGVGFAPNLKGIAIGQCRADFTGPSDCNLAGGATFRNADASGSVGTITLKLAETFGDIDCTKEQCVIAAAPLPTTSGPEEVAANTATVPLTFGKAAPPSETPATPPAGTPPAPAAVVVPVSDLAVAGAPTAAAPLSASGDGNGVLFAVIGTNLLLAGVGLYLGMSRRRTGVSR